jgi:hypothetical protein
MKSPELRVQGVEPELAAGQRLTGSLLLSALSSKL